MTNEQQPAEQQQTTNNAVDQSVQQLKQSLKDAVQPQSELKHDPEAQKVQEELARAIDQIQTPEQAEAVLDAIDRATGKKTVGEVSGKVPPLVADAKRKPSDEVLKAAQNAPEKPEEKVAATLVKTAETAVKLPAGESAGDIAAQTLQMAAQPDKAGKVQEHVTSGKAVTQAVEDVLAPKVTTEQPYGPGIVGRSRELLQEAVLKRMTPLQSLDARAFLTINHLPHNAVTNALMYGLTIVATGGGIWVAGQTVNALLGDKQDRQTLYRMLASLTVGTMLVEGPIKNYFRRKRPFITVVQNIMVGRKPSSWSFPSGHSASSFACATALTYAYPKKAPLFYALAALVGFTRVYLGAHYPGDVASGATIGTVSAVLMEKYIDAMTE